MISGYCDSRFTRVADVFRRSIRSGHEIGATLAIEYQGQMIVNLWGGYRDRNNQKPWEKDSIASVFSSSKGAASFSTMLQMSIPNHQAQ